MQLSLKRRKNYNIIVLVFFKCLRTKDVLSYHGNVRAVHGLVIAFDDQTVTLYNMRICFMSLQQNWRYHMCLRSADGNKTAKSPNQTIIIKFPVAIISLFIMSKAFLMLSNTFINI